MAASVRQFIRAGALAASAAMAATAEPPQVSSGVSLTNTGTITGGAGGMGGSNGTPWSTVSPRPRPSPRQRQRRRGHDRVRSDYHEQFRRTVRAALPAGSFTAGVGGVGVSGSNLTIIDAGTISVGASAMGERASERRHLPWRTNTFRSRPAPLSTAISSARAPTFATRRHNLRDVLRVSDRHPIFRLQHLRRGKDLRLRGRGRAHGRDGMDGRRRSPRRSGSANSGALGTGAVALNAGRRSTSPMSPSPTRSRQSRPRRQRHRRERAARSPVRARIMSSGQRLAATDKLTIAPRAAAGPLLSATALPAMP